MWHNIVWVALAETRALEKVHDVGFTCALLVEAVLVLFETDCTAENDFVSASGESVVRVVKHNLD